MPLATDLAGVGLSPAAATRLGWDAQSTIVGSGTAQATATMIRSDNVALSASAGNTAFILSTSNHPTKEYLVYCSSATQAVVYPPIGAAFDGLAVNTPVTLSQGQSATFMRNIGTAWSSSVSQGQTNGTWTPVISFDTPGTLSITYSAQWGEWYLAGNMLTAAFNVSTSVFTVGTASGNFLISGLPYAAKSVTSGAWAGSLSILTGITKANYTQFQPRIVQGTQILRVSASGSGQTGGNTAVADFSGTQVYQGSITYPVA